MATFAASYKRQGMKRYIWFIIGGICALTCPAAPAQQREGAALRGTVRDVHTREPLPYATVVLQGDKSYATLADPGGYFQLRGIAPGGYEVTVSYVGYEEQRMRVDVAGDTRLDITLRSDNQLREVVVTATEAHGPVAASRIDRTAMTHLQPTSLADLMELLPGGVSRDPDMGTANTIALRETGTTDASGNTSSNPDYAISSLGTLFVVDGAPVNTDANLQYSPLSNTYGSGSSTGAEDRRNITNRGVDMRTIATDDIESIEVIRGIPSAEYGNLTSGVVNIKKIRRATPLNARFKADGYSKLVAVGKGFALPGRRDMVLNVDAGYLDSKSDPTNNLENFRRLNFSGRLTWHMPHDGWNLRWEAAADYTGSFDNSKQDPDLNFGRIDEYRSVFNRTALTNSLAFRFPAIAWLTGVDLQSSISLQADRLTQTRLVSPQRYALAPTTDKAGEHDASILFAEYTASYLSDGKPFNTYLKLKGDFLFTPGGVRNHAKAGLQWDCTKNFGRGQVYDLGHPLSAVGNWDSRPRDYRDIPALHNLAFFAEDLLTHAFGLHRLEVLAGLRGSMLPGLDKAYTMHGRIYLDPRLNGQWTFPGIRIGREELVVSLAAGLGWTTKMPTLNYLYPDLRYNDITQLAYYDDKNPVEHSRFTVMSYIQDQTNYRLQPARNRKWEVRADFAYAGNRLSVCYFDELTTSGFRYVGHYAPYAYKDYDESAIDGSALQAPPDPATVPYEWMSKLASYRQPANGSLLRKQGVEWQFTSERIKPLRTAVNFSGAWFKSEYTNSLPVYYPVNDVVDNIPVSDHYVGIYDWDEGQTNWRLSTNLMLDTQVPEWGLIFTSAVQCVWYTRRQLHDKDGIPMAYIDVADGQLHPYTAEAQDDPVLQHLAIQYNEASFLPVTVPMALYVNFKATKKIGKHLRLAFFANKLLDYTPDYEQNGFTIRRNVSPYFGMELNVAF